MQRNSTQVLWDTRSNVAQEIVPSLSLTLFFGKGKGTGLRILCGSILWLNTREPPTLIHWGLPGGFHRDLREPEDLLERKDNAIGGPCPANGDTLRKSSGLNHCFQSAVDEKSARNRVSFMFT